MTREEIIMEMEKIRECGYVDYTVQSQHALDVAIETLKIERPKGHWLEVDSFEMEDASVTDMRCGLCGKYASVVLPHGNRYVYNFCPNCGADMRGEKQMTNIEWLRTLDVEQLSKWITEWAVKYQYKYTLSERALTDWLKEEKYNSTSVKEESND